jgi:predicted RNase H-like nuclease (RuvC/YqgF family)
VDADCKAVQIARTPAREIAMNHRLDLAKQQLQAASEMGLAKYKEEIAAVLKGLDQQERLISKLRAETTALQSALTMQESIIDDLNSRINALEAAIRDYLDPSKSRNGADVLITVLEKELGEEESLEDITDSLPSAP